MACAWLLLALAAPAQLAHEARTSAVVPPAQTVLVMGDSLSAAHGLAESQGWVALIGTTIAASKPGWRVVNASISGETTAGGAARVAHELSLHHPAVLVIELGANDGLRGLPLQQMRANLATMMTVAQATHARILLIGMRIPPNYGAAYTHGFEQTYRDLARQFDATLLPFLLEPIALDRNAFQTDDLHPVASAEPRLRYHVWKALAPLLK
jgi:acyl-CoA thioesterase-1